MTGAAVARSTHASVLLRVWNTCTCAPSVSESRRDWRRFTIVNDSPAARQFISVQKYCALSENVTGMNCSLTGVNLVDELERRVRDEWIRSRRLLWD